ncbi:ankyrin repeat-containing domain protein [Podospora didyma]|uniref:Ankyrin repeat-containing domain protein n=1 Tax=Podospora didyma TaxID=330526 RepID=A0AAE0JXS9_9PEZI|nr:ankyrin repeat-containing domain protein [Podospora didyma]
MVTYISSLPAEIVFMVAKNLLVAREKSAFARTCRGFYDLLTQEFWRDHWDQALRWGIRHGSLHTVRQILEDSSLDVDPNKTIIESSFRAWEPLHGAVAFGHEELVKYLLSRKADVAHSSSKGLCRCATFKGMVQMLPLHTAICLGFDSIAIVLLMESEADPALTVIASAGTGVLDSDSILDLDLDLDMDLDMDMDMDMDLDMDMDMDMDFDNGDADNFLNLPAFINPYYHPTALHTAAHRGRLGLIDIIADRGFPMDFVPDGYSETITPLLCAILSPRGVPVIRRLANLGANLEARIPLLDYSPLAIACLGRRYRAALELLALGASVHDWGTQSRSCNLLHLINGLSGFQVMETVQDAKAEAEALPELVVVLRMRGVDIEQMSRMALRTPLSYAFRSQNYEVMEALLQGGADPDTNYSWDIPKPLLAYFKPGHSRRSNCPKDKFIWLLLDYGAEPSHLNRAVSKRLRLSSPSLPASGASSSRKRRRARGVE